MTVALKNNKQRMKLRSRLLLLKKLGGKKLIKEIKKLYLNSNSNKKFVLERVKRNRSGSVLKECSIDIQYVKLSLMIKKY